MDINKPKVAQNKLAETMTPAAAKSNQVRATFMFTPELHRRLKLYSVQHNISMSKLVSKIVSDALDKLEK